MFASTVPVSLSWCAPTPGMLTTGDVAVRAHGIWAQPLQPSPWLFVIGASLAPKSTVRWLIAWIPPPEPIAEYWSESRPYIGCQTARAGAISVEPAPFRVPVDRFPAAPALVTA